MRPAKVRKFCVLDETGQALMQSAMNQLQLSARALPGILHKISINYSLNVIAKPIRWSSIPARIQHCITAIRPFG
jgi:predicted ATPase with chaperone activity